MKVNSTNYWLNIASILRKNNERRTTSSTTISFRAYLYKRYFFEVPGAQVFTKQWQPELNINLSSAAEKIDPTHFEVSLKVVVQANNDNETAFIVDVTQSGIFLIDNIEEDRLPYILGAYCPNILFPFLREAVNDLVTKGSFPQLLLTPINFDAEFEANMQRAQAAAVEGQA